MRILGRTGLVRVEIQEWPIVLRILRSIDYLWTPQRRHSKQPLLKHYLPLGVLWSVDGYKATEVTNMDKCDQCVYLDERALLELLENAQ